MIKLSNFANDNFFRFLEKNKRLIKKEYYLQMNYKNSIKLFFIILAIGYSNFSISQSYKVACLNDYPPYSSINTEGQVSGFLIDWWRLWGKEMGQDILFVPGNIDDCITRLDNNEVDIIAGGFYSEDLSETYDFGDQILGTQALLCVKKSLDPESIDSINFPVTLVKNGYTKNYMKEKYPYLQLKIFDSNSQLHEAIAKEGIDAFIYITPTSVLDLVDISIPKGYKQFEILFSNKLRPMVKKGNEKILADIMKGSESISNEDLLEVAKKWNVFKDKVAVDKTFLYVSIIAILLFIIGLLLVIKRNINKKKRRFYDNNYNLKEEINKGESDFLEFKSSLRWDYHQNAKNKQLEQVIAKTISAFLNSNGGMLLIGIDDDGAILGLENDYKTLSKSNKDGFVLTITTLINNTLGKQTHKFISIKMIVMDDKDLCAIRVEKSSSPVFMIKGEKEEFYIRASASSQPLGLKDTMAYIKSHWDNNN
jgi:ABC-type amino acid transport substrate-binding protein